MSKIILFIFLLFAAVCKGQAIRCFGDSFTQGLGAASQEAYPSKLSEILSYPTQIIASGGASSTDIKDMVIADSSHKNYPTILWSGYNNVNLNPSVVITDNEWAMSSLGHTRYLVLSIMNNCSIPKGTSYYNNILFVNNKLKQDLGIRFLDIRDSLVHYKSGDHYWDSVSIADDVPNHFMMWDCVHCNAAGYNFIAQKIAERQNILFGFGGPLALDSVRQTARRTRSTILHYDVYNLNGVLLKTFTSSSKLKSYDILAPYPEGVYIICLNGKCVQYMRW